MRTVRFAAGVLLFVALLSPLLASSHSVVLNVLMFYSDPVKGLWAYGLYAKPVDGRHLLNGISGDVVVVVDSAGVPHIFAEREVDACRVLGYVMARDRFWQMDFMRRVGLGNLSALLGEPAYDIDVFMRRIGYHMAARESLELVESLAKSGNTYAARALECLQAFSDGVNQWLSEALSKGTVPVEYRLLGVKPEPWRPVDSLAVAMVIVHGLAFKESDAIFALVASANNASWLYGALLDLEKWLKENNYTIIPGYEWKEYIGVTGNTSFAGDVPIADPSDVIVLNKTVSLALLRPYTEALQTLHSDALAASAFVGLSVWGASNNWVVSGNYTATGYPLLANDPHLSLTVPPVWYLAHVVAHDTGLNVYGVTFPGIPFIVIGRNTNVAFGYTNTGIDVVDFYYYKWSDGRYYYRGEWLEPAKRHEEIIVRTPRGYEVRNVTILETVHGPVFEYNTSIGVVKLAVKTTAAMANPILVWVYVMNHAESVYDVFEAQRYFYAPIQNAVAADTSGNILYSPAGLIPVRTNLPRIAIETPRGVREIVNTGFAPFNGSSCEGEWIGFIDYGWIPRLLNPKEGYVVTANNYIAAHYEYRGVSVPLQDLAVCDRYRFERIRSLLEEQIVNEKLSVESMTRIQLDTVSLAVKNLLEALKTSASGEAGGKAEALLAVLDNWDYNMDPASSKPTIAFTLLKNLHETLWKKLFDRTGISEDYGCRGIRVELTEYIIRGYGREYLAALGVDDARVLLREAAERTVAELSKYYGTSNPDEWVWGKAHRYAFTHVLGKYFKWLNYDPLPAPGDPYTVNPAPIRELGEPVAHGPSVRLVADLAPGATGVISLPGGNSGNPFSRFFDNLYFLWARGDYIEIQMPDSPEEIKDPVTVEIFEPTR